MLKFDTEGFVPVASLNGAVVLSVYLIRCLIGATEKYDLSYTLLQNKSTLPRFSHVPNVSVQLYVTFSMSLQPICSFPDVP